MLNYQVTHTQLAIIAYFKPEYSKPNSVAAAPIFSNLLQPAYIGKNVHSYLDVRCCSILAMNCYGYEISFSNLHTDMT